MTVQVEELLAIETQLQTKLDEANNELLQTSQGKARVERELKAKCENEVCIQDEHAPITTSRCHSDS